MSSPSSSIFPYSWLTDLPEPQTLTTISSLSSHSDQNNNNKNNTTHDDVRQKNFTSLPPRKKPTKRKSRASKKTHTTYISADPANFRQMVQQVTGAVRFNGMVQDVVFRPEPQRIIHGGASCLPTLDTSAFSLDHVGSSGGGGGGGGVIGEFDSFPTLESSFSRAVETGFVTF